MLKNNEKVFNRLKIEKKISIKLLGIALFVLLLTILLTVKPNVNTKISFTYYLISVLGLFILFFKYNKTLGLNISDEKINSCYNLLDILSVFVIACTVFQMIFIYAFFTSSVEGTSMLPTLEDGQFLIIKSTSKVDNLDIIIIDYEQKDFHEVKLADHTLIVKRVIAKGGDTFYIEDGFLYLNGLMYEETYTNVIGENVYIESYKDYEGIEFDYERNCYVVQEGYYFVLGDNRTKWGSNDSRVFGLFKESQILGKVEYKANNLFSWEKLEW